MSEEWILGKPVQTDTTNYEWVLGAPYVVTEEAAAPPPSQTELDYERKFRGVARGTFRGLA